MSQQIARSDDNPAARPDADTLDAFAGALRALRREAGDPTLAALERRCGISKSVLSDAFNGKTLPTERTLDGLAQALGGNVEAWLARRRGLDPRADRPTAPARPATVRRRTAVAAAIATGAVASGITLGICAVLWEPTTDPDGTTPLFAVENGTDPAQTPCVDDAAVVASETRERDTQLQIVYSEACHAAWARITRYDGASAGNTVSASIYRQIAPDATDRQDTTEPDAQSAYTALIVRDTPQTRLCADGTISLDGEQIDLGSPVCL